MRKFLTNGPVGVSDESNISVIRFCGVLAEASEEKSEEVDEASELSNGVGSSVLNDKKQSFKFSFRCIGPVEALRI